MTDSPTCGSCGQALSVEEHRVCAKCLLQTGLEETNFSGLPEETPTLAPSAGDLAGVEPMQSTQPGGPGQLGSYCDLTVVHDWSGGTVYQGYHPGLDRRVLLRVLESNATELARREFLSRAETLAKLNHPHTIATLEAGECHGAAFVAEEWVDGETLTGFLPRTFRQRLAEGFFPNQEVAKSLREAALGLQAIHDQGLTHGRLNPDLIVRDTNGVIRITGLGASADADDDRFARPDQRDRPDSIADDIYRLGATFYYLTSDQLPPKSSPPRSGPEFAGQLKRLNPGLNAQLCQVIGCCLEHPNRAFSSTVDPTEPPNPYDSRNVSRRHGYASAVEVATDVERFLTRQVDRVGWRARINSMLLEGFCLALMMGLTMSRPGLLGEDAIMSQAMFLPLVFFGVPVLYVLLFETCLGWTPARRFFGLRLLNHAGERRTWWRRLMRATFKLVLGFFFFALPAFVLPLTARYQAEPWMFVLIALAGFLLPPLAVYLPSRWISCGWTFYDLLTGVTWAEESNVDVRATAHERISESDEQSSEPLDQVGQYDIFETIGAGGMGNVYRARDRVLGREVAIKVLAGHLLQDPLLRDRFQREAKLAAKVSHANVARVFGTGVWGSTPYIAMELVNGTDLRGVIKREGKIPLDQAWHYIVQAAEALRAADLNGVVHRDVKPANLMITSSGQLKVTDFGVSRHVNIDASATQAGSIVGTPAYMAPEQAMGKHVDCRSDIYALGMTLYHMLSGRAPFDGANAVEVLAQQLNESPPPLFGTVADLTSAQQAVLAKMIAKDPEDRYGSYDELLAELRRYDPVVDQYASPTKRIAAEMCNWGGAYFLFTTALMTLFLLGRPFGLSNVNATVVVGCIFAGFFLLVASMYVFGVARRGRTPGMKLLQIRVARVDGSPTGYLFALLRFLAAYPLFAIILPLMVYAVIANVPAPMFRILWPLAIGLQLATTAISLALLWLHPARRTVPDLLVGSIVVRDQH